MRGAESDHEVVAVDGNRGSAMNVPRPGPNAPGAVFCNVG